MNTNCDNCGGVLTLERYQDRLSCEYCGTVHFPSLAEEGHVRVLDGAVTDVSCPGCERRLSQARIDSWPVLICRGCKGLLVHGENLLRIVLYCRDRTDAVPRAPEPIDPRHLERKLECPRCGGDMLAHPYYGPGDFVIDACIDCREVWLDGGELGRASTVKWGGSLWR